MNYFFATQTVRRLTQSVGSLSGKKSLWGAWVLLLFLMAFTNRANGQTNPSSITVSGACLSGSYTLTKITDDHESTGKPAYQGTGDVTINSTLYPNEILTIYYEAAGPAWVLAFGGQPYQANYTTTALPPASGWVAVTEGVTGTCTGANPLTVSYTVPTVSVATSAASVCTGNPFSVTATATNFSASITNYSLTSNPAGITGSNASGIFTVNAPSVSGATVYTLTITASDGSNTASNTALITVNPTPTLAVDGVNTAGPTRCDTPNGQIGFTTNVPNGSYSVTYAGAPGSPQTVVVTNGRFALTGLPAVRIYGFSFTSNGCTGVSSVTVVLVGPTPPSVSITPSATAICAGQTAQLTASGANTYVWGTSPQQNTASIFVTATGAYSVTGIASNGCSGTATANVTVNPLPTVSITGLASSYCQGAASVPLSGSPANGVFTVDGSSANSITPTSLSVGQHTVVYSYTNANGCVGTASQTVTINALPNAPTVTNVSYCQGAPAAPLTASGTNLRFYTLAMGGESVTSLTPSTSTTGNFTYYVSQTNANGCESTRAPLTVTVKEVPGAPGLLTQTGQSYPGNQSAVNVDLNSGNVTLLVSGCTGTVNWTGPNNASGMGTSILVPTTAPGTFVYQATCTTNDCTSLPTSATVTVGGRLTVLHRDVDNYATNNAIQPLLVLQNQGNGTLSLSAITLRYYVTVEGAATLGNLSVNYAQVGNQNVKLKYVPLQPAQQGAAGYVEVSFTAGAGSLAPGASSGSIQGYFTRSDYGALNEVDDYSYNLVRDQLVGNLRITAYYNGVLIAGLEPGSTTQIRALRALTESKNGPSATQINTFLTVRNEGNVAVNYSDLRVRYYFTTDGNERLQVEVDEGIVQAQLYPLSPVVGGANYYLEIRFNQGGQLAPGASTGRIRYRISKPDGGRFNQANDYSYQEQPQDFSSNNRVLVYVGSDRVWGNEPSGSARQAASVEPLPEFSVRVLGNPVTDDQVRVEVTGAQGQPLRLSVSDLTGRLVSEQQVETAGTLERQGLDVSQSTAGMLLLQVSTPTQSRTVKVFKAK